MMTFLLFAGMREAAGMPSVEVPEPVSNGTMGDAWRAVCERVPSLAAWDGRVAFARNGEYVGADAPVEDGDELAAIPPVSGG